MLAVTNANAYPALVTPMRLSLTLAATLTLAIACSGDAAPAPTPTLRPDPVPVDVASEPTGATKGDPSFQALPGATAHFGELGGTIYRIEMPDE